MKITVQAQLAGGLDARLRGEVSRGVKAVEIDASGHLIFTLTDGSTADLGKVAGEDGFTPVRGTDYWTAEDIAVIKGYVDDAILGGEW